MTGYQALANAPVQQGRAALNDVQRRSLRGYEGMANTPGLAGGAALNDVQRESLGAYRRLAGQTAKQGSAALNDVQRNAMNMLNPIANGSQLTGNPYLEDMIARGSQDIGNAGNLMASANGRYGSDSHAQALGKNIADFAGNTRFNDYNNQQPPRQRDIQLTGIGNQADSQYQSGANRQLEGIAGVGAFGNQANNQYQYGADRQLAGLQASAPSAIRRTGNTARAWIAASPDCRASRHWQSANNQFGEGVARQMAGIYGAVGIGNQADAQTQLARNRQTDAIGSLFNAGTQQRQNVAAGTQQLTDAFNARKNPYNTLLGVGAKNEDLYARTLADRVRVNAAKQAAVTAPLDYLAQLANLFQGGTTVQTGTQPGESPLSKGISGALSGYATTGNPFGAILGGLGGFI